MVYAQGILFFFFRLVMLNASRGLNVSTMRAVRRGVGRE